MPDTKLVPLYILSHLLLITAVLLFIIIIPISKMKKWKRKEVNILYNMRQQVVKVRSQP